MAQGACDGAMIFYGPHLANRRFDQMKGVGLVSLLRAAISQHFLSEANIYFFSLFFREGECFDYRFRRAIFPFLFRNTKVKLKQSCFTFGLTGLDWLRYEKKKMGVGCWDPSNLKCGHTNESTRRRTKRGVVCILSLFIIEKKEKRRKGKKKRVITTRSGDKWARTIMKRSPIRFAAKWVSLFVSFLFSPEPKQETKQFR